ncbi:MAG: serine/threonine protein kinase [Lachnospiraceae bacterium]|nr:serine/threonine protein kinase [Lachnospiraceae bacterium]
MDGNFHTDTNNGNEIYYGFCPYCMNRVEPGEVCSVCGLTHGAYHASPHHLPPGTVLMGRYLVGRVLGEGGFGITYIGCDLRLEMKVAIKEYFPVDRVSRHVGTSLSVMRNTNSATVDYEKGIKKFLYEARTMARMEKQPQIVMVRDFFEKNNTAYIIMEYVDGTNFMELVKQRGGKIPPDELFSLVKPLFGALGTVHKAGLLHRDISPDNLMLEDGMIRLLDFGCAREAATGMETMTVALKQGYGPIEQYQGKGQGPWTDVYALSATIYYCLTGNKPPQALDRTLHDELIPPRDLGVDITPAQQKALLKGMAVNPGKRYRSVEELYGGLYTTEEAPGDDAESSEENTEPKEEEDTDTKVAVDGEVIDRTATYIGTEADTDEDT